MANDEEQYRLWTTAFSSILRYQPSLPLRLSDERCSGYRYLDALQESAEENTLRSVYLSPLPRFFTCRPVGTLV
jgi:hypothetical protein